jgi:GrpB-like predicted nucleotidyltransferase (UPF0157 family)
VFATPALDCRHQFTISPTPRGSHPGWHYVPPALDQRPHPWFFIKVVHDRRAAHLHLMTTASAQWHQQLAFRDALRANPDIVRTYAQLKHEPVRHLQDDHEAYPAGKQRFVDDVLAHTT